MQRVSWPRQSLRHPLIQPLSLPKAALFDAPFTAFHHAGVAGVFPAQAATLIDVIERVNHNARVA